MVDSEKKVQVLAKEGWNPGVLGIVAGRLLEELGQTVIVLNIEDGRAKGSARSVEAVDIFEALDPHRDLFIAFGGHAGAAGMTLEVEKLSDLSHVLEDYVREKGADAAGKNKLNLDEELDWRHLAWERSKVLNVWHLLAWTIRNLPFISRIFRSKVPVLWGQAMLISS